MLSKIDIDMHLYKKYKNVLNNKDSIINTAQNSNFYILYDRQQRLIAVAKNQTTVKDLANVDKFAGKGFATWEMKQNPSLIFNQSECWKYRLDLCKENWIEDYQINSLEDLDHIILTNQKAHFLDKIYDFINEWYLLNTNTEFQQNVYFMKYLEVKDIIFNKIEKDDIGEYPHTTGYAKLKDISLQQAAKQIKLQYENLSAVISEVELLRLKYKNLIVDEVEFDLLKTHYEKMIINFERYGRI
jgi:hypothetical protein